jgi:Reeler domain
MPRNKQAKVASLVLFAAALFFALVTDNRTINEAHASAFGPPDGHTGAPGELTCAVSGCHGGRPNTGPGEFLIEAPSVYEPGMTYRISVSHNTSDSTRQRWGFQLTALTSINGPAGHFANVNDQTQIFVGGPGGNRQYIEHSVSGTSPGQRDGLTYLVDWTAPSTDVGPVVFYAAGNQANNDATNDGDQIYTATATAMTFLGPPEITGARVSGKKLFVLGKNFAEGSSLFMCACENPATDGSRVKKTKNDSEDPSGLLVSKKGGKDIEPGATVNFQVRSPDGTLSAPFSFKRE